MQVFDVAPGFVVKAVGVVEVGKQARHAEEQGLGSQPARGRRHAAQALLRFPPRNGAGQFLEMLPVSGRTQCPHHRLVRRLFQTRFGHPRRPAPHALPQAHVAGAVQEGAHRLGVQAPQGFVAAAGNRHVLAWIVFQDDVGAVGQQRARQAVFQGDLGNGLPVGPHDNLILAVVP